MITIDGHTFETNLIGDGWIIDSGCRGWKLSEWLLNEYYRNKFYCIDIENLVDHPNTVTFKQAALTTHSGQTEAYYFGDGTANFIKGINDTPYNGPDRPCRTETIPCITLQDIYNEIGTDIDLLKLDIEGAEYEVLESIEPIPKQITVEFHQHCHPKLHNKYIDKVIKHLTKDYKMILHVDEPRYLYMDVLFIRRDLV